jgi:hypothetical protein
MQALQEPVNSLLSSYEALPGGSNPQRKECEAAINYNTPFTITPDGPGSGSAGPGNSVFPSEKKRFLEGDGLQAVHRTIEHRGL